MRKISFSNYIEKFIHNIETLELPYGSTYKLLKDKENVKLQEKMIAQKDIPHEKKLFNVYSIESEKIKSNIANGEGDIKEAYRLIMWIRIINPRFKCKRYVYPGDYIAKLIYNPYGGWELAFYQDACDRFGNHELKRAEHPHIQNGRPCFGGHKTAIDNSLWSANFFGACKLIRKYIEEYNGRDTYTRGKYHDIKENELSYSPLIYGHVTSSLNEEQKKEWYSFQPIEFKTYRLKNTFRRALIRDYTSSCFNTNKDIFNTFKFFNKIGRFEEPNQENDNNGLPIEQTLNILKEFDNVNPYRLSDIYNPLWENFCQSQNIRRKLKEGPYPLLDDITRDAYNIIYKNGGYYFDMKFRFSNEELKPITTSYERIREELGNDRSTPALTAVKWCTQNIDIFIAKSEEMMESSTEEFSFDLKNEVEDSMPNDSELFKEVAKKVEELVVIIESLKYVVTKEKLHYLERERRKVLNEINNNTAEPETHQLSLGSL